MKDLKAFYKDYDDKIRDKRYKSPYLIRRYAHYCQYNSILDKVTVGTRVLDAGCGDGVLSILMAQKGAVVVGTDISEPNIEAAKKAALEENLNIDFRVADIENLPFPDDYFDLVVSSHVLEHIPDFDKGLREVMRVTKKQAIVAIPTILNGCSLVQIGGSQYFVKGLRTFLALPYGFILMVGSFILGREGVDEGYAGNGVEHIFRFPSVMRKKIRKYNYSLISQEASTLCLPYFESLLPVSVWLDKFKSKPILRNFGYGTTYTIQKS